MNNEIIKAKLTLIMNNEIIKAKLTLIKGLIKIITPKNKVIIKNEIDEQINSIVNMLNHKI